MTFPVYDSSMSRRIFRVGKFLGSDSDNPQRAQSSYVLKTHARVSSP